MAPRIALLRGVNLGKARRAPMAEVRKVFEDLGWTGVRSLGQSGNLVFEARGADAAVESAAERALHAGVGLATEVFVRGGAEWRAMMAANPFPDEAARDPAHLVVMVLKSAPGAGRRRPWAPSREENAPGSSAAKRSSSIPTASPIPA
jgi:uncharacterized protein (DUF1697 family)